MPPPITSSSVLLSTPAPPPIGGTSALSWFVEYLIWMHLKPHAMTATGLGSGSADLASPAIQEIFAENDAAFQAIYAHYAKQVGVYIKWLSIVAGCRDDTVDPWAGFIAAPDSCWFHFLHTSGSAS
jgi:hypothetical protein